MLLINNCKSCKGLNVCTKAILSLDLENKYHNIIFMLNCDQFISGDTGSYGTNCKSVFHNDFNHCDDCIMIKYCKYFGDKDMHDAYIKQREKFIELGYNKDEIKVSCTSHTAYIDTL